MNREANRKERREGKGEGKGREGNGRTTYDTAGCGDCRGDSTDAALCNLPGGDPETYAMALATKVVRQPVVGKNFVTQLSSPFR